MFDIRNNISDFDGGKLPTRSVTFVSHKTMDGGQNYRTEHNLYLRKEQKCIRHFSFKNTTLVLNNILFYNKNKIYKKWNNDGFDSYFYSF